MRIQITMDVECDDPNQIDPHDLGREIAEYLSESGAGLESWSPPSVTEGNTAAESAEPGDAEGLHTS